LTGQAVFILDKGEELMTTLTAPVPQAKINHSHDKPINLFQLGCLFVIRAAYWSGRISNEPQDFEISEQDLQRKAIASLGTKDLVDPDKCRKIFQQIEKKARHELSRYSRPFPAANAHFVPWEHVPALVEKLDTLKAEFEAATQVFLQAYPLLRAAWQKSHPDVPDAVYPAAGDLARRFRISWNTFKVAGAGRASAVDDLEAELAGQAAQADQLTQLKENLQSECQQFVADYVLAFRKEVAGFCDQVIAEKGQVHGKTLQAIRRKIEHFHAMNIFGDASTAAQLKALKQQILGVTGEDLAEKPDLASKLNQTCAMLKAGVLDSTSVSQLTGRLKRRVVLD
jgi:hypothetical protein